MIDVWWVDLADLRASHEALLSTAERGRADRYRRTGDRARFVAGVVALRLVVGRELDCDPAEVDLRRDCPDCDRQHGRPRVLGPAGSVGSAGLEVSVSHSGQVAVIAVARGLRLGVDVELVGPDVHFPVAAVLGPAELAELDGLAGQDIRARALARCWVHKEAVLKATGDGLRRPMTDVCLAGLRAGPTLRGVLGGPSAVVLQALHPPAAYVGALAVLSAGAVRVREQSAGPLLGAPLAGAPVSRPG